MCRPQQLDLYNRECYDRDGRTVCLVVVAFRECVFPFLLPRQV